MKTSTLDNNGLNSRVGAFSRALLAMRRMQDQNDAAFIASLGKLSVQQLSVINAIGDKETATMSDIAKCVSLSLSSVTLIVDKLVKQGLVKRLRDRADRRVVHGSLTKKGAQIYQVQVKHLQDIIRKMFSVLTDEEQKNLVNIFQKLTLSWKQ